MTNTTTLQALLVALVTVILSALAIHVDFPIVEAGLLGYAVELALVAVAAFGIYLIVFR